jgi:hypothetical protein
MLRESTAITIGGVTVVLRTTDPSFIEMIDARYVGFAGSDAAADYEFDVDVVPAGAACADEDVRVRREGERWVLTRGDFHAEWNPDTRRGTVRQSANPYSLDSVLRIVHTLVLAGEGGFLLHAAGAIRNGRAFLFSGVSEAGKTTISRLAPPDATLLTDEISYVRRPGSGRYIACGTPFAGELATVGENVQAPLAAVYLLAKGAVNAIEDIPRIEAARALLRNTLFFAEDAALVDQVFAAICEFVDVVPVQRLTFAPTAKVWELIQ